LSLLDSAWLAVSRGYTVIPIRPGSKVPALKDWSHWKYSEDITREQLQEQFDSWNAPLDGESACNLGVVLGENSGNLVDVDLDHPRTLALREHFLPYTPARSGRLSKPYSHYWYVAEEGTLPGTRQHKMPRTLNDQGQLVKGAVTLELRSTGAQTVIPVSTHPSGEKYEWHGEPWGGPEGPTVINGRKLAVQVALLGLAAVLVEYWPKSGSRHEAYLALAGGLLRDGDQGVHPWWERNASVLIRALADVTHDEDGPDVREQESIDTTVQRLNDGQLVTGFGKLAEIIGEEPVKMVRILVGEVEHAAGVMSRQAQVATPDVDIFDGADAALARDQAVAAIPLEDRDPLTERISTWEPVDLEPYLTGRIRPVEPTVLVRDDGLALFYPGRVNMLYGSSESAKSWIATYTCTQVMAEGQRAVYLDFEDEPVNTLDRLRRMGAAADDVRFLFTYIRPEDPLAPMQRDRWGNQGNTPAGERNLSVFMRAIDQADPALIVADGMTVLYGLHGLDSNDAVSTDIITGWLKKLTRNGRSTVIIIDHTAKGSERGSLPIGSQHKVAMVQGTMIQVWPVRQPMPDAEGEVELIVLKDRPGQVRKISAKTGAKAQLAARVIIDSTVPDVTTLRVEAPAMPTTSSANVAKAQAELALKQKHREDEDTMLGLYGTTIGTSKSWSQLIQELQVPLGPDGAISDDEKRRWNSTLNRLIEQGWLFPEGNTRARRYTLAIVKDDTSSTPPASSAGTDLQIDLSSAGSD
jgi:hypothetical protein